MPGLYFRALARSKTLNARSLRTVASPKAVGLGGRNGNLSQPREAFHVGRKEDAPAPEEPAAQASMMVNQTASLNAAADTPAPTPTVANSEGVIPIVPVPQPTVPNTAETPGIIPQTSTIPSGSVPYFRTGWTGEAVVGKGFMRETNQFKPTALSFDSAPPENIVTTQNQRFSVISKAKEFSNSLAVGASVAVEAYGAEVSAAVEVNKSTQFSKNSVTVSLMRSYKSDPIIFVDPISSTVQLDGPAKDLLKTQGPKKFHEVHGTHYIAGYTVGGLFSGYVQLRYSSKEDAESAKATVEFAVGKLGVSAAGSASFESEATSSESRQSTRANYSAIGWNVAPVDFNGNIKAPPTVTDMESLLEAANQMETDDGQRLEAVLASYEDLSDYRTAVAEYTNATEGDRRRLDREAIEKAEKEGVEFVPSPIENFEFLPKENFMLISQLLNNEMLCLDFLDRSIDDLLLSVKNPEAIEKEAHKFRLRGFLVQRKIRQMFSIDADARDNWLALAAYIDYVTENFPPPSSDPSIVVSAPPHNPNVPIEGGFSILPMHVRAEKGRQLANEIFECETIEKELDVLVATADFPETTKAEKTP